MCKGPNKFISIQFNSTITRVFISAQFADQVKICVDYAYLRIIFLFFEFMEPFNILLDILQNVTLYD